MKDALLSSFWNVWDTFDMMVHVFGLASKESKASTYSPIFYPGIFMSVYMLSFKTKTNQTILKL